MTRDYSDRLMRRLARIAGQASLAPHPTRKGALVLTLDGQSGVVRCGDGFVWLLLDNGKWDHYRLPKGSVGTQAAQRLYNEIVHRERLAAERRAAYEESRRREEERLRKERERDAARSRSQQETQAQFDAIAPELGILEGGVRFLANTYGSATLILRHDVTPAQARAILIAAAQSGAVFTVQPHGPRR